MKTRRDFLRTAAGTLAGLGTLGLVAPVFGKAMKGTLPDNSIRQFSEVIRTILDNNRHDARTVMKLIAEAASPVVNKEIDRILAEKLPFVSSFGSLGEKEKSINVEIEDNAACGVPGHGYLPKSYTKTMPMDAYDIGYSVDISNKYIEQRREDIILRSLKQYINGITNKIYLDVMSLLLASAYYRNIIHISPTNEPYDLLLRMSGEEAGVNGITDLFVDDDMFNIWRSGQVVPTEPNGYSVHRLPELNEGGDLYKFLTFSADKGGFGMMMPIDTKHLVFGLNRNCSSNLILRKTKMSIYVDDSSRQWINKEYDYVNDVGISDKNIVTGCELSGQITSDNTQLTGFYGWLSMICATIDNNCVVLGAV